ncbi:hypothetical protein QBC33DRAFT_623662 [Phialemonium atrogriseum]|uniref:Uncharacterized protein n=1 Tax=Phialemonium atrogriseum TaxID=1093897 RepID=A0AAJ0BUU1_9PEZI|nr:uncharacterized protein QBC33DRAFT_623662 [Phialemonium atrogriseum]KAK1762441.1 hypothetical protein QBC33DRAFT_623662 [Phialemonium atrogriseum]
MAEQLVPSTQLLCDALQILGNSDVVEHAQKKRIILSKFPKKDTTETWDKGQRHWTSFEQEHVTGLSGRATVAAKGFYQYGNGKRQVDIKPGDYWELRWDYDPGKGSHVNVKVGNNKFAVLYPDGSISRDPNTAPGVYFDVLRDQTSFVGYKKGMNQEDLDYCAGMLAEYYRVKF